MTAIKRFFGLLLLCISLVQVMAQSNGSNSSYSRFGLGLLNDQSQGFNRGMGGVAQGFRSGIQVNMLNPASYSATDSLTFILDAGMSLQMGRLSSGSTHANVTNTSLEYVNAAFRLKRGLGMSIGFVPYSTIGYNFTKPGHVSGSPTMTTTTTYYGTGGLHELYAGIGWNPFADLSIGANIGYVWGEYSQAMLQTLSNASSASSANTPTCLWSSDLRSYKLDLGAQYPIALNKTDVLTLGATMSVGHSINSDVNFVRYTSMGDTTTYSVNKAFELPYTISAGASWSHKERLTIGADYTLQKWDGCRVPILNKNQTDIEVSTTQYCDLNRLTLGAEYTHDPYGRKYRDHIRYRLGGSYANSYVKVNGKDGPSELRLTAGVALPLKTSARSLINVSVEWLNRHPSISSQIKENYLLLHIGITFNEAWFMKWKFQ